MKTIYGQRVNALDQSVKLHLKRWNIIFVRNPISNSGIITQKLMFSADESQSHHYTSHSDETEAIQKDSHLSSGTPQTSLQDFAGQ